MIRIRLATLGLLALAPMMLVPSRVAHAEAQSVSIRATEFLVEQPDRVREIQVAFSAKNDAMTIDLERLDRQVETPRRENPQYAYERSMWNATRGLAPRVEIQCVVAEGGEAQVRVWDASLERYVNHFFQVVRARNDGANLVTFHENTFDGSLSSKVWSEMCFDEPKVGRIGLGGPDCDIAFLEVHPAQSGSRANTCSVHYAPDVAPPTER